MNARPRLWVIDPSCKVAEDQGVRRVLDGAHPDSRVFEPALSGDGPRPGDLPDATVDGIVVLGSGVSVYEDHAWLSELSEWLLPWVAGEHATPLLGICFGHQLIAHLAGGSVGFLRTDRSKDVGYRETTVAVGARLAPPGRYRVLASHREVVTDLSVGWRTVASREDVTCDGFEHDTRDVHAVQFHPEASTEFLERAGLDAGLFDDEAERTARAVLGTFRDRCAARASRKITP